MSRKELKALAKLQIDGKLSAFFIVYLIAEIISLAGSMIYGIGFIISIVAAPAITLGLTIIYLRVASNPYYRPKVGDLFAFFDRFWQIFKVTFFVSLFTSLWSLLFIVPGIVKACSYSQAIYIAAENPNMGALDAIRESERIMAGKKMDYFLLSLSFIGWALLAIPTLGLIGIWLEPYYNMTMTNFYNSVKPVPAYGFGPGGFNPNGFDPNFNPNFNPNFDPNYNPNFDPNYNYGGFNPNGNGQNGPDANGYNQDRQ